MKYFFRLSAILFLIPVLSIFAQLDESTGSIINHRNSLSQKSPNEVNSVNFVLPSTGGSSQNSRAPQGYYKYGRCVYLITPAEMQAYGVPSGVNFTSLGFVYSTPQPTATTGTFQIYFMNTSDVTNTMTTSWATIISGMTKVDSGDATIPTTNTFDINLTNPTSFTYTGGGIYVAWEYSNPSGTTSATPNTADCNTNLAGGLRSSGSSTAMPTTIGSTASAFRPVTRLGYLVGKDAAVQTIYTLGKLAIKTAPHKVSSLIVNTGDSLLTNVSVTLNITGANTFTNSQTIASIPVGGSATVTFGSFYPTNLGLDTVKVSLASDANLMNNNSSILQSVTNDTLAYSDGSKSFYNAFGFGATSSGAFVSKFFVNGTENLKLMRCFVYSGAGNTVRAVAYNNAGTLIGQSADYVLQSADTMNYISLNFASPVTVTNDSVYVGLYQTPSFRTSAYYPVGTLAENPTRSGAFFEVSSNGTITDDGVFNVGRFMIEAAFEPVVGTQLFQENFDFSGLLTANGYTVSSGGGTNALTTSGVTGLTFNGYPAVSGNAVALKTSGEDDFKTFTADSTGSVYLSFLLNASAAQTGDYFIALSASWAQTNYYARVHAKATTGGYLLGFSKNNEVSGGAVYGSTVLSFNTTYLAVVKYQFNPTTSPSDTNNDALSMWVFNNTIPSSEPNTGEIMNYVLNTKADAGSLGAVTIRQGSGTAAPTLVLDGIRIGTTWFNSALPVELTSFTASVTGKSVNLSWKTATELNNKGFFVERKSENENWVSLGFVKGNGNSLSPIQYSFIDNNTSTGKYSYRLRQIDFNGTSTLSPVVNVDLTAPRDFSLNQNYPNPFNPSTKISYQIPVDAKVKIELYNITGQKIADLVNTDQSAGSYSIDVNANILNNIASGVYIYKMTATSKVNGVNFINAKKMMLMK